MKTMIIWNAQQTINETTIIKASEPFTGKTLFEKEIHASNLVDKYIEAKIIELQAQLVRQFIKNRENNYKYSSDYINPFLRSNFAHLHDLANQLSLFSTVESQIRFIYRMLPKLELIAPKNQNKLEYFHKFIHFIKTEFTPEKRAVTA